MSDREQNLGRRTEVSRSVTPPTERGRERFPKVLSCMIIGGYVGFPLGVFSRLNYDFFSEMPVGEVLRTVPVSELFKGTSAPLYMSGPESLAAGMFP